MKLKGFWYDKLLVVLLSLFVAAFIGISAFVEPKIALCELAVAVLIFGIAVFRIFTAKNRYKKFMQQASKKLDFTRSDVLSSYPFPVAVVNPQGYIAWCNGYFLNEISDGEIVPTTNITEFCNDKSLDDISAQVQFDVFIRDKYYSVYSQNFDYRDDNYIVLFYLNNTVLKKTSVDYNNSRPYALIIDLDNLDISRSELKDSERSEIRSRIEAELDKWAETYNSALKKVGSERYLVFTEKVNYNKMSADKFSILETIREFNYNDKNIGATLSIGVSSGESFRECEAGARKALEMALARGGDQVAIKKNDSYNFFGGVSQSAEKKSKVKIRVAGQQLLKFIEQSSNVLIMGHAYSDFDAVGSAVGLACAINSIGIPVHVVTDRKKTLALPLIERFEAEEKDLTNLFIGEEAAKEILGENTFVIVVDTHVQSFFEFPEIYDKASKRAIIDHHRRSVTELKEIDVFHLDAGASSASEMVTEILPYINPTINISVAVAEALLAGIMLDTKNFVLRSGVRTFEAAAYLRKKGAKVVQVKKLFANSIEISKLRNKVINNAEIYKDCAVSAADFSSPDIRIITSQAADELLNVSDVIASFVMFENNGTVNISARSLNEINVQIIMESLGGGGHSTMAACQLKGYDIAAAKSALFSAIDDFFVKNS